MGWLSFTNRDEDDISGTLNWLKAADAKAKFYPAGFNTNFAAIGSTYLAPVGSSNHVLNLTNASVAFSGGNIDPGFVNAVTLGSKGTVTNLGSNTLSMSFTLGSGTFQGSVTDPSSGIKRTFSGVVLQKRNEGQGFALGTNQSGRVVFGP